MLATLSFVFSTCTEIVRTWKVSSSVNRKSKEDIDFGVLAANTAFNKQELRKYFFDFKNACPDGALSPSMFELVYRKYYPKGSIKLFCQKAFRSFDRDQDGQMDFVEFVYALDIISSQSCKKKFDWFFRLSDTDRNGVIDQKEFEDVCKVCVLNNY
ncbi:hypothetical protein ACOME3_007409 [Neoechinorhynchus agilis]